MPVSAFIDKCCSNADFERRFNLEFKIFDEFNLLGLKSDKPQVTNQSDVANPSVDDDDEGFHTPDEVMHPVQEDDEN